MTNPIIHTLVLIAAVLIPGGLLVYFTWRATKKVTSPKAKPKEDDLRAKLERMKRRADKKRAQKNSQENFRNYL